MNRKNFLELEHFSEFEALWDRLMDRFDRIEEKIERLQKKQNFLNGDELMDTQDMCLLLKTCKRSLARYRKKGVLPYHTIEGKVYYKSSDIHEFIRNSFQPARKK
jgi:hypothetical protein